MVHFRDGIKNHIATLEHLGLDSLHITCFNISPRRTSAQTLWGPWTKKGEVVGLWSSQGSSNISIVVLAAKSPVLYGWMSTTIRVPWRRILSNNPIPARLLEYPDEGRALVIPVMNSIDNRSGGNPPVATTLLPVNASRIGELHCALSPDINKTDLSFKIQFGTPDIERLMQAAKELRETDIPVAFPTETVYGLGADVTRSSAVRGIFKVKQRPSDNPLIVHISSLQQLRNLMNPKKIKSQDDQHVTGELHNGSSGDSLVDASGNTESLSYDIPEIYHPLIQKFWPGPLTLIMPNPRGSVLAPEVTAHLQTFGVRMPKSAIALALIELAGVPLAAPSANASSKPSPTSAAHVKHDLDGRIATIIDGGPCDIGVESTVVDGLADPPLILRPGGISLDQLRSCPGWENVSIGYHDIAQTEAKPKAPGMKYKHYSPKAKVILYEAALPQPRVEDIAEYGKKIGLIRTNAWTAVSVRCEDSARAGSAAGSRSYPEATSTQSKANGTVQDPALRKTRRYEVEPTPSSEAIEIWDVDLGDCSSLVARGLFSALRELDQKDIDAIVVEGIDSCQDGVAAAVMNRLRKAATEIKA